MPDPNVADGGEPPTNSANDRGTCLCLSGGGFRACLFHLGAVRRLNELGVLAQLSTITSVSGGSILNGVLGSRWARLVLGSDGVYSNFEEIVAVPVRAFCSRDFRTPLLFGTRLNPINWRTLLRDAFAVSGNFVAKAYEPLFGQRLSELPLPDEHTPRFIFCATNIASGACWHFHGGPRARMGDFYVGYCDARDVGISDCVAASSAFPLGFSAYRLRLDQECVLSR